MICAASDTVSESLSSITNSSWQPSGEVTNKRKAPGSERCTRTASGRPAGTILSGIMAFMPGSFPIWAAALRAALT